MSHGRDCLMASASLDPRLFALQKQIKRQETGAIGFGYEAVNSRHTNSQHTQREEQASAGASSQRGSSEPQQQKETAAQAAACRMKQYAPECKKIHAATIVAVFAGGSSSK